MRKTFLMFGLVAASLLALVDDASAQRFRRRGGITVDVGTPYYYSDGRGYYNDGRGYFNDGRGYYYDSPSFNGSRSFYYAPNDWYSADCAHAHAGSDFRQSGYFDPNSSMIQVFVPVADAQIWFDDTATTQRGMERVFQTGALQQNGTYTIKAKWTENGKTVDQQRQVQITPGQSVVVDFRMNQGEKLSQPKGEKLPQPK